MHAMWQQYNRQCYSYIGMIELQWVCASTISKRLQTTTATINGDNDWKQKKKKWNNTERNEQKFTLHTHNNIECILRAAYVCAILNAIAFYSPCARYVCKLCCLHFFLLSFCDLTSFWTTCTCDCNDYVGIWPLRKATAQKYTAKLQNILQKILCCDSCELYFSSCKFACSMLLLSRCFFSLFHTPHHSHLSWLLFLFFNNNDVAPWTHYGKKNYKYVERTTATTMYAALLQANEECECYEHDENKMLTTATSGNSIKTVLTEKTIISSV